MTSFDAVREMPSGRASAQTAARAAPSFGRPAPRRQSAARRPSHHGGYPGKRALDLVLAATAVAALAPLLALIWFVVVSTSPGPGLHWSPRVGRYGRKFWMPKFRTMRSDAPRGPRESLHQAEELITPVGAWLRRLSFDELPQLFSIVGGDMSFVGPRPLLADDPGALAREQFQDALEARPGLSGLAQVKGRNHLAARRKARFDAFYARRASLALDVEILLRTLAIVFSGSGFI
jgi:O-antigen biosynthesis protein WbqP